MLQEPRNFQAHWKATSASNEDGRMRSAGTHGCSCVQDPGALSDRGVQGAWVWIL